MEPGVVVCDIGVPIHHGGTVDICSVGVIIGERKRGWLRLADDLETVVVVRDGDVLACSGDADRGAARFVRFNEGDVRRGCNVENMDAVGSACHVGVVTGDGDRVRLERRVVRIQRGEAVTGAGNIQNRDAVRPEMYTSVPSSVMP